VSLAVAEITHRQMLSRTITKFVRSLSMSAYLRSQFKSLFGIDASTVARLAPWDFTWTIVIRKVIEISSTVAANAGTAGVTAHVALALATAESFPPRRNTISTSVLLVGSSVP
jgi:hypothetical protein